MLNFDVPITQEEQMIDPKAFTLLARAAVLLGPNTVEVVGRHPHATLMIQTPEIVRRVYAVCDDGQSRVIRRTYSTIGISNGDRPRITHELRHIHGLQVKKEVVEEMIRSGELVMIWPPNTYQQDLYWRDDQWFRQNRAALLQGRDPYMP